MSRSRSPIPDSWPYVATHPVRAGQRPARGPDRRRPGGEGRSQIAEALGFAPTPEIERGFAGSFCSSLVHDVNATTGLLDRLGVADTDGEIVNAAFFANGDGGLATIRLRGGQAVWQMTHLAVPAIADYDERITLTFDDRIVELRFPSPYLNHFPTRLTVRHSDGRRLETREIRPDFGEAFVLRARGFLVGDRHRRAGPQHRRTGRARPEASVRPRPARGRSPIPDQAAPREDEGGTLAGGRGRARRRPELEDVDIGREKP